MPFHFSLQAVLHYRESLEHQQELRLRSANQMVTRVRRLLELQIARCLELQTGRARELAAGTTAAELRFHALCQSALERQRQEIERELRRLETLRDEQQKRFIEARRRRETLDSLRDRQRREYERWAARREQRRLDDAFLLRRSYLQGSRPRSTQDDLQVRESTGSTGLEANNCRARGQALPIWQPLRLIWLIGRFWIRLILHPLAALIQILSLHFLWPARCIP